MLLRAAAQALHRSNAGISKTTFAWVPGMGAFISKF